MRYLQPPRADPSCANHALSSRCDTRPLGSSSCTAKPPYERPEVLMYHKNRSKIRKHCWWWSILGNFFVFGYLVIVEPAHQQRSHGWLPSLLRDLTELSGHTMSAARRWCWACRSSSLAGVFISAFFPILRIFKCDKSSFVSCHTCSCTKIIVRLVVGRVFLFLR